LVPLPIGKSIVRCQWLYTLKARLDSNIDCYKVRLAAKRYTQIYSQDYLDTFPHVAKMTYI